MRVKVGDQWYEATPDQPIMVELDDRDIYTKYRLIHRHSAWYAEFAFEDTARTTDAQKLEWMTNATDSNIQEKYFNDKLIRQAQLVVQPLIDREAKNEIVLPEVMNKVLRRD